MEKKLEIGYYKYTIDSLPAADSELVAEAQEALKKAYPKYSGFSVGAAVRLKSGKILHGANSESEVFPRASVPSVACYTMPRLFTPMTPLLRLP